MATGLPFHLPLLAMRYILALLIALVALPGCYHATVMTGRTPGTTVVDKPFALGFIYGIVPPPTVNVAQECPQGVAMVETEQSIVNALVSIITAGIVTPMHIKVTCASGSASLEQPAVEVAAGATTADIQTAFADAAELAVEGGEPVLVAFK